MNQPMKLFGFPTPMEAGLACVIWLSVLTAIEVVASNPDAVLVTIYISVLASFSANQSFANLVTAICCVFVIEYLWDHICQLTQELLTNDDAVNVDDVASELPQFSHSSLIRRAYGATLISSMVTTALIIIYFTVTMLSLESRKIDNNPCVLTTHDFPYQTIHNIAQLVFFNYLCWALVALLALVAQLINFDWLAAFVWFFKLVYQVEEFLAIHVWKLLKFIWRPLRCVPKAVAAVVVCIIKHFFVLLGLVWVILMVSAIEIGHSLIYGWRLSVSVAQTVWLYCQAAAVPIAFIGVLIFAILSILWNSFKHTPTTPPHSPSHTVIASLTERQLHDVATALELRLEIQELRMTISDLGSAIRKRSKSKLTSSDTASPSPPAKRNHLESSPESSSPDDTATLVCDASPKPPKFVANGNKFYPTLPQLDAAVVYMVNPEDAGEIEAKPESPEPKGGESESPQGSREIPIQTDDANQDEEETSRVVIASLETALREEQARNHRLYSDNQLLHADLQQSQGVNAQLHRRLTAFEQQNEQLITDYGNLEEKFHKLLLTVGQPHPEVARLNEDNNQLRGSLTQLQQRFNEMSNLNDQAIVEINQMTEENNRLQRVKRQLQEETEQLKLKEVEETKAGIDSEGTDANAIESAAELLEFERGSIAAIEDVVKQSQQLTEEAKLQLFALDLAIKESNNKLDDSISQLKDTDAVRMSLEAEVEAKEHELNRLLGQIAARVEQLETAKDKLDESKRHLDETKPIFDQVKTAFSPEAEPDEDTKVETDVEPEMGPQPDVEDEGVSGVEPNVQLDVYNDTSESDLYAPAPASAVVPAAPPASPIVGTPGLGISFDVPPEAKENIVKAKSPELGAAVKADSPDVSSATESEMPSPDIGSPDAEKPNPETDKLAEADKRDNKIDEPGNSPDKPNPPSLKAEPSPEVGNVTEANKPNLEVGNEATRGPAEPTNKVDAKKVSKSKPLLKKPFDPYAEPKAKTKRKSQPKTVAKDKAQGEVSGKPSLKRQDGDQKTTDPNPQDDDHATDAKPRVKAKPGNTTETKPQDAVDADDAKVEEEAKSKDDVPAAPKPKKKKRKKKKKKKKPKAKDENQQPPLIINPNFTILNYQAGQTSEPPSPFMPMKFGTYQQFQQEQFEDSLRLWRQDPATRAGRVALTQPQRCRSRDFIAERIANANNIGLVEALGIDAAFGAFREPQESLREPQESFINFFVDTSPESSDTE